MARNATNQLLHGAKRSKSDEFYTQLKDIEAELQYYKQHFKNKTVYCNCDDPRVSNFYKYFVENFHELGLRKVIASCFRPSNYDLFSHVKEERGFYYAYTGSATEIKIPCTNDLK